jgi:hypothetical protein
MGERGTMGGGGRRLDDRGWVSKTECVRGRKEREKMGDERGKGIYNMS